MPELPEVETVKNVLINIVKNKKIIKIDVLRNSNIVGDPNEFVKGLEGETYLDITRIGKFLIFHMSNEKIIISHLRMEGKYFEVEENEPNTKYARVVFHLNNNKKICYDDSRCFGILKLSSENTYKQEKEISQLGPEPFDITDSSETYKKVRKSNLPIKSLILDQTIMTGNGNIYADETLFASKIHPLTPGNKITENEWETIISNSSKILKSAIEAGGSTIRSYHPGKNIDGNFQFALKAYGKVGENCPNCGHPFRFIKVGGRGTTYCPICQIKKGHPIHVGIMGKISSGKSTVLDIIKNKGYKTISADDIVHTLYKNKNVCIQMNTLFGFNFKDEVDIKELRDWTISDIKNKKRLEKFIHPLVKNEIVNFLKQKDDILFVEVPLLYEAKLDNLFDVTIAIDINIDNQINRLKKRNPDSYKQLEKINSFTSFEENKKKVDFIIENNADLDSLNKQVLSIINKLKDRLN